MHERSRTNPLSQWVKRQTPKRWWAIRQYRSTSTNYVVQVRQLYRVLLYVLGVQVPCTPNEIYESPSIIDGWVDEHSQHSIHEYDKNPSHHEEQARVKETTRHTNCTPYTAVTPGRLRVARLVCTRSLASGFLKSIWWRFGRQGQRYHWELYVRSSVWCCFCDQLIRSHRFPCHTNWSPHHPKWIWDRCHVWIQYQQSEPHESSSKHGFNLQFLTNLSWRKFHHRPSLKL